jgi:hypothetical protein
MTKLSMLAVTALLVLTSVPMIAQAQGLRDNALQSAAQNFSPIHRAACRGWGPWCGPGWVRRCGPWGCRCVPCW